jgi:integrase
MKSSHLKLVTRTVMRPVGRKANATYRVREHLTEDEIARLLDALSRNRHGNRDRLIGLLIYRHSLRVSEACDLRWDDLDFTKRTIEVRRLFIPVEPLPAAGPARQARPRPYHGMVSSQFMAGSIPTHSRTVRPLPRQHLTRVSNRPSRKS